MKNTGNKNRTATIAGWLICSLVEKLSFGQRLWTRLAIQTVRYEKTIIRAIIIHQPVLL